MRTFIGVRLGVFFFAFFGLSVVTGCQQIITEQAGSETAFSEVETIASAPVFSGMRALASNSAPEVESDGEVELIVGFHEKVPGNERSRAVSAVGGREKAKNEKIGAHLIRVPSKKKEEALSKLKKNKHVRFAEPNFNASSQFIPNDPYYGSSWHLKKVEAPIAWDLAVGDASLVVAVVDSGQDALHKDLAGVAVPGWNFFDNNADTTDVTGHGTRVAGTIGAIFNNGIGVAGLASGVRIMPLRVSDSTGWASYYAMSQAITYATDNGARIINISMAGSSYSSTLQSAVNYAWTRGVIVFAAAGNYNTSTPYYPAATDKVIAVAATTSSDTKSSFSNFGPWITITAPGSSIYTTSRGGGYGAVNGTSFSSPLAAAGAALALSANPGLDIQGLKEVVIAGVDDIGAAGFDATFGHGRLNARKVVEAALAYKPEIDTTPPVVAITAPADGATITGPSYIKVQASDNKEVTKIEVLVNGKLLGTINGSSGQIYWSPASGEYLIEAKAYDAAGNVGVTSVQAIVPAPPADTTAPVVTIGEPNDGSSITKLKKLTVRASATDNVGVTSMVLAINGSPVASTSSSSLTYNWNLNRVTSGVYTLVVTACDAANNCASKQVSVTR